MKSPKILLLVGHGLYQPWIDILHEGQRKTWLNWTLPEGMQVIHSHGTPVKKFGQLIDKFHEKCRWTNRWTALGLEYLDRGLAFPFKNFIPRVSNSELLVIEQESIHVHIPDTYFTQAWQNLAIFNHFLNKTDADFLFSTTTSSLIKPKSLQLAVKKFDLSLPVYAGVIPYEGARFAAGNNRLLSRKAIELIMKNRNQLNFGKIEDLGIGNLLSTLGVPLVGMPSLHISSFSELDDAERSGRIESNFHIRVKSGPLQKRNDVALMKEIFLRVEKSGGLL